MNITIPFSEEMIIAAIYGDKLCTSRREKKGEIGDVFCLVSPRDKTKHLFKIVDIQNHSLAYISDRLYRLEGVETPFEFIELWKSLHRGHYNAGKIMYVHFFKGVINE